jgi:hypothetical protein
MIAEGGFDELTRFLDVIFSGSIILIVVPAKAGTQSNR